MTFALEYSKQSWIQAVSALRSLTTERLFLPGAYLREGIAAYNARSGNVVWTRRDLKAVQIVTLFARRGTSICGFERGPLHVLALESGETLGKVRGTKN